jgi:hypothetical protein
MIGTGATANALQRAVITHGMATMRDVALGRVRRGETTLQEVERVIGDDIEDHTESTQSSAAILVVNPDPAWRRMARAVLEGGEFRVIEATDASQAMQIMSADVEVVLTLTDMSNPAPSSALLTPSDRPRDPDQTARDWPGAGAHNVVPRTQH